VQDLHAGVHRGRQARSEESNPTDTEIRYWLAGNLCSAPATTDRDAVKMLPSH
jgi:hypothetical protein